MLFLSLLAAGGIHIQRRQAEATRTAHLELETIADLKVQQIAQWRAERLADARFFAQAAFVARDVAAFLRDPSAGTVEGELTHWLTLLKGGDRYARISLFDAQGIRRLVLPAADGPPGPVARAHAERGLRQPQVQLTDLHRGDSGQVRITVVIPVLPSRREDRAATSTPLAVMLLDLDPHRFLYPLIQSWPTPSASAETMLMRRDGAEVLYLNELRHRQDTALELRLASGQSDQVATQIARGELGLVRGNDYRGIPVVAAVRAVPDSPWFMVAKVDRAEIYAPLRRETLALGSVLAALLLAGVLGVMLLWRRRDHEFLKRELAVQTDRAQLAEQLRALSAHTLRLQDEERRRLARELHDTTAQNLAALSMNLAAMEPKLPSASAELRELWLDCRQLTDRSAQEIRTFSYLLHPPLLDEFGLIRAVRDYAEGFSHRSGIRLELDLDETVGRLPPDTELALFRVLQESLGNVLRHSGSPTARIRLACEEKAVCLEIADAGRGLPPATESGERPVGVGILGMRERLRQLGGRLELQSASPGVRVRAVVPSPSGQTRP